MFPSYLETYNCSMHKYSHMEPWHSCMPTILNELYIEIKNATPTSSNVIKSGKGIDPSFGSTSVFTRLPTTAVKFSGDFCFLTPDGITL